LGVEGEEAQPKKSNSRRYVEALLGWAGEDVTVGGIYETALVTSVLEYLIVLFFGLWLVIEYFYNIYEQQYFGSFNPIFLVLVLLVASGYGFTRLISLVRHAVGSTKRAVTEDDY
jgi:hypothetical protein